MLVEGIAPKRLKAGALKTESKKRPYRASIPG
jgi:hypothetical protein